MPILIAVVHEEETGVLRVWQCSKCPETTAFGDLHGLAHMNDEFRRHCSLVHPGEICTPYELPWQPFDQHDPSTYPENHREVEVEYPSGKRSTVMHFLGSFAANSELNPKENPIPAHPLRWRYTEREAAK